MKIIMTPEMIAAQQKEGTEVIPAVPSLLGHTQLRTVQDYLAAGIPLPGRNATQRKMDEAAKLHEQHLRQLALKEKDNGKETKTSTETNPGTADSK